MGTLTVFEPVIVPGQDEEPAPEQLLAEIASWVRSDPLRTLIRHFGNGKPSGDLASELAYLEKFTIEKWKFRKDKERNQVDPDAITGEDEKLAMAAADALGLVRPHPPRHQHYDHVVILGGLVRASMWRPAYAAHLLRSGLTAGTVTAISAYRDLAPHEDDPSRDEYKLLEVFGLPRRAFEWEVMEDGLRRAFNLPAFTVQQQSPPDAEGPNRYRVAFAEAGQNRLWLVVAPALERRPRANTADGYRYWAGEVGHVKRGQRILAITTCIYLPYQHAVALQHLGIPFGCRVETVGVDFSVIDDSLCRQEFRGVNYLLEVRSAIHGYRQLVTSLLAQGAAAQTSR
jgi:hypothetical protein